jgi:hypothetical protein
VALIVAVAVYAALRINALWAPYLWGDEVFNYFHSHLPWKSLLTGVALDMSHPPLFYLMLKPWVYIVGSWVVGLRMFTVAISLAAIVPFVALGRALYLRKREIVLALCLMAVNNYLILYSYYLRPYCLLSFLALCSNLAFVRFLRSDKQNAKRALVILVIVNTGFVYTHYFAWLVVIAQYLWIVFADRARVRQITVAMAMCVLFSLPWVGVIAYASTRADHTFFDQMSWFRPPGWENVVLLLRSFDGGFESTLLTLGGAAIFLLILVLPVAESTVGSPEAQPARDGRASLVLLAWLAAFPVVVSLLLAQSFTLKWEPRYVIVSIAPYLLLVSARACRLRTTGLKIGAIVFLLAWSTAAGLTDNLAEKLHGPNVSSYWLVRGLSRAEARTNGPIRIYASPYAEQGLRLALDLTHQRRFQVVSYPNEPAPSDRHFWIALAEHDPLAAGMLKKFSSDTSLILGDSIYSGVRSRRQIVIPVVRK